MIFCCFFTLKKEIFMLNAAIDVLSSKPLLDGLFITTAITGIAATAESFITGNDVVLDFLNSIGIDPKIW